MLANLRTFIVLLVLGCALHLPALLGERTALPADGPVLVRNSLLETGPTRSFGEAAADVLARPEAAWSGMGDTVGRTRWRPLSGLLHLSERALFGSATLRGVTVVSVLLHAWLALQTFLLAGSLLPNNARAAHRAAWIAALVVLATPLALSSVAWPARQAVVLAAALGFTGLRSAVAGRSSVAVLCGGVLLAAAGLAHEAAFALALTVPALRGARSRSSGELRTGWLAVAVAVGGAVLWLAHVAGQGGMIDGGLTGDAVRSALGVVLASAADLFVPARTAFAEEPLAVSWAHAGVGALTALALAATLACGRGDAGTRAALGATLVAIGGGLVATFTGSTVYGDALGFACAPLWAVSAACCAASLLERPRAFRLAGAAAAALLLGASVAATITRASSYTSRDRLVALAQRDAPDALLTHAWALIGPAESALQAGPATEERLLALAPQMSALGRRVVAEPARSRSPEAAATVGSVLAQYALRASDLGLTPPRAELEWLGDVAAGAAAALPQRVEALAAVAAVSRARIELIGAFEATVRAANLSEQDATLFHHAGEIALALGNAVEAADHLGRIVDRIRSTGGEPPFALRLTYARALATDGSRRELRAGGGWYYTYDLAIEELQTLIQDSPPAVIGRAAVDALFHAYLQYGDFLATADKPPLALLAYGGALKVRPEDPVALEHAGWLGDRLRKEERAAAASLTKAQETGGNIANALVELGVVYYRQGRVEEGDAVFEKVAIDTGMLNPPLRLYLAVHRFAASPLPERLERARAELQQVIGEDPTLVRARYELAEVLWSLGEVELAAAEFRTAARLGIDQEWALDAVERAEEIEELLARLDSASER